MRCVCDRPAMAVMLAQMANVATMDQKHTPQHIAHAWVFCASLMAISLMSSSVSKIPMFWSVCFSLLVGLYTIIEE